MPSFFFSLVYQDDRLRIVLLLEGSQFLHTEVTPGFGLNRMCKSDYKIRKTNCARPAEVLVNLTCVHRFGIRVPSW